MDCGRVQDRLSDYVEQALSPEDRDGVEAHLRGCPECAAAAEGLARLLDDLAALPPLPAPPELLRRVMAEVGAGAPARAPGKPSPWRLPLRVAATLLFVALGYGIGTGIFGKGGSPLAPGRSMEVASAPSSPAAPPSGAGRESRRRSSPQRQATALPREGEDAPERAAVAPSPVPHRLPQEIPAVAMVSTGGQESSRPIPAAPPFVPNGQPRRGSPSREMVLLVPAAALRESALRVGEAAARCGALPREKGPAPLPAGSPSPPPDGPAETVRVTLPRAEAARFVSELRAIGPVMAAFALPPSSAEEGEDVSFTVRLVGAVNAPPLQGR